MADKKETGTAAVAVKMEKPKPCLRLEDEDIDAYLGEMPKVGDAITLTVDGVVTSVTDSTDKYDGEEKRRRSVVLDLTHKPKAAADEDQGAVYRIKAKMQERSSVK